MHRSVRAFALLSLFLAAAAEATTIVLPADEQLIAKSPVIVEGIVRASHAVDRSGGIWTETTIDVTRALRGDVAGTITVAEIGGELGDRITKVFGAPEFIAGEQVLLFLEPHGTEFRTMDLFVGKFTRGATQEGQGLWIRSDSDQPVRLLDGDFRPLALPNVQRDATRFEAYVTERAHGREGDRDYLVANPVLAKSPRSREAGELGGVSSNFTLISDPSVYRWFLFDNGQAAQWYSHGTQPGYTDGGIAEIKTAMAAWTGYASAKIYYSYAGAGSGSPSGLGRPNGVNEVLLGDPLGEITGTYNPATGGVVGQGGFNAVRSGGYWTAPFAADASHPAGSIRAFEIAEANLTIQDGVSPSARITSDRLAEIVSHEFGHTLGFGHSPDGSALMYSMVTGLGPALRADDQMAARWLYPASGSAAQPQPQLPLSPSSLTATVSGTSVVLQWADNASTETSQTIYYAAATGSFTKAGTVGANATSATLSGFSAGTYRFYVTASNANGESMASNTASATIAAPLAAGFSFTPQRGSAGITTFTFTDESVGTVTSRAWNFGDGASSTAAVATHLFAKSGQYTVTLTVTGTGGAQSQLSKSVTVDAALTAGFTFSPASPTTNDTITFADQTTGGVTSWQWSFGDGTWSQAPNPSKRYTQPGTYNVTLTAYRNAESSSASRTITVAAIQPFRSLVSVTAQTDGVAGTTWRTELSIFNAGDAASVELVFIPGAGGAVLTRSLYLGARQSLTYGNTLLDLFGLPSGAGALAIEATNPAVTPQLKISSRTYTGGSTGTYGQSVPDVSDDGLGTTLRLTGIASNASFRTNIGLVNRSDSPVNATLALLDASGNTVATTNVAVAPRNFQQAALSSYFPAVAGRSYDVLSMNVVSSSSTAISAYASVVDNRTQDPVYIQGAPSTAAASIVIPAVGRSGGANGTYWRSDVTIYNPAGDRAVVALRFLPAGSDNRSAAWKAIAIGARQTLALADVLAQLGIEAGTGALEIGWDGTVAPVVASRTYTTTSGGGTYGQSIDPVGAFKSDVDVPGLRSDASYRSNVGFVNGSATAMNVRVQLLAPAGYEIASTWIALAPKSQVQYALTTLFPNVGSALGSVTLSARSDVAGALFAYGSMVDNTSGDPVFFAGR